MAFYSHSYKALIQFVVLIPEIYFIMILGFINDGSSVGLSLPL